MTEKAATMTDRRGAGWVRLGPPHIGVMFGLSTAAYAVTLAGVTALQSGSEAALAAERAPAIARIDTLAAGNQRLADELAAAGATYNSVAAAYSAVGGSLADLEAALGGLATSVKHIDGVSRSLPSKIALPSVGRVSSGGGGAPSTSSTTGASGG
jgi:hypothetical protein